MSSPSLAIADSSSGLQKVAIVLLSLGPVASAEILKKMPEEDVDDISEAIATLGLIPPQRVEAVLTEFHLAVNGGKKQVKGDLEDVRQMLTQAFGQEYATKLIDRVTKSLDQDAVDFDRFRRVDPQQLAKFIQDEHPQTIALVLSHLDPSQAAALVRSLPPETHTDIVARMAALEQISPESVRTIATAIGRKLRNLGELSREACGGVRSVADMLNRLDPQNCGLILDALEKENPALFESARRLMFVFDDLKNLDDQAIRELFSVVDRRVLQVALKGASAELTQRFLAGLSSRGAEMMKSDIEELGPVKIKDVDAAQQQIITQARQLEKDGTINLKGSAGDGYIN